MGDFNFWSIGQVTYFVQLYMSRSTICRSWAGAINKMSFFGLVSLVFPLYYEKVHVLDCHYSFTWHIELKDKCRRYKSVPQITTVAQASHKIHVKRVRSNLCYCCPSRILGLFVTQHSLSKADWYKNLHLYSLNQR